MATWTERVLPLLAAAANAWGRRGREHAATLDQMCAEDDGLFARADEMRRRRRQLDARLAGLRATFGACARDDDDADAPTDRPEPHAELRRARHELLHWISDVRELEGELATWLQESLYRDRGVVD